MSTPEQSASAAISLPKGGGSVRGIGETFQPSVFDGTASFTVPIAVSPGRSGFGPELKLTYSSGNGNGPFGLGWALSIPNITRKTEKGLPRYDAEDVFVLSGAEDLVPLGPASPLGPARRNAGIHLVTAYRPRVEGLFARIERWRHTTTLEEHWRVTTKDNVTSIYGRTAAARISHPNRSNDVFQWLLEDSFDSKGNHILYEYAADDTALPPLEVYERGRGYAQRYLRRIFYGNLPASLVDATGAAVTHRDGNSDRNAARGCRPSDTGAGHSAALCLRSRFRLRRLACLDRCGCRRN
jgi:hypothetical protein